MRAIKFSEDKLEFIVTTFMSLINEIESPEIRVPLLKLMDDMGERIFEAPASHNLSYHNCCVGGLAEHSLRVYNNLKTLVREFGKGEGITHDSIVLVALFHDLGKVGSKDEPYYIPEDNDWQRDERGAHYKHNPKLEFLGGAQRSIRVLTEYGVPLTEAEYKAILVHDGQYIPENKPYAHKEGMLGMFLHQADFIACKTEQYKWERLQ